LTDPAALRLLAAEGERLGAAVYAMPAQPLHGDAHAGNVLVTPSGPMWNDFEDAWCGPVEWDYACASDGFDSAAVAVCRELRGVFGVAWHQLLAHHFPDRASSASSMLSSWLAEHAK